MAAVPERENRQVIDEVAKVREEIRKQVQEAIKALEQQRLADRLRQEIKDSQTSAKEFIQADRKGYPDMRREEGNKALYSLVRAAEAAKAGITVAQPRTQVFLAELAGKSLTASTASTIQTCLGEYLSGAKDISFSSSGQAKSSFEESFENLKATNSLAASLVAESLVQAAREGKLNLSEEEARRKFDIRKLQAETDPRATGSPVVAFSPDETRALNNFSARIASAMKFDKGQKIFEALRNGTIADAVKTQLLGIGFTEPEINELARLTSKTSRYKEHLIRSEYERYFPAEDRKLFNYDYLVQQGLLTNEGFTDDAKRLLKRTALRAVNMLFEKVDASPDREFQNSFSEFHEGYIYRDIQDIIINLMKDPKLIQHYGGERNPVYEQVVTFINEGVLQEVSRERELRELFHNVGIWIKLLDPQKLSEHMARYNISEVTSVAISDVSGKLVSMAMNEYERYLQFDVAKNEGKLRPALFSGKVNTNDMFYEVKDRGILEKRLKHLLDGLRNFSESGLSDTERESLGKKGEITSNDLYNLQNVEENWELPRAIKYAIGLHLTQTIRGYEITASTRPPRTFEGSSNNFYDMSSVINPGFMWTMGRGVGSQRLGHIKEMLLAESIVKQPKESLLGRIFDWSWNPKKLHDKVQAYSETKLSENWEHMKDSWLYQDMSFRQLLNKFGLGGLASRAGWRLVGFKDGAFSQHINAIQEAIVKNVSEKDRFTWGPENWDKKYDALARIAGVGTRFWFDAERASDYVKKALWKKLNIDVDTRTEELDKLWYEYTEGKHGDKKVLTTPDGEKMTVLELLEAKTLVFQGMNFQALLERSPLDFLNNLLNAQPDFLPKGLGGSKSEFYFTFKEGPNGEFSLIDEATLRSELAAKNIKGKEQNDEVDKILHFQRTLKHIWGEKNFKHLKEVRLFYLALEKWGRDKAGKTFDKEKMFEEFYRQLDLASEKVKLRNGKEMKPEDIEDPEVRKFFFGGWEDEKKVIHKGLVNYFKELNENYGTDAKGKDTGLGEKGFFYHVARAWYNEIGHGLHPNTSDVDWRYLLHNLGERGGENIVKRLWGDLAAWNGVMKQMMDLDHMFMRAANSHSFKEIEEFQDKMHKLEGISGKPAMYEMQYYFAQLVARYFQEHRASTLPFPLGSIYSLFNGKELALSRIYGGRGAMTLTTDGVNAYFHNLANKGYIQEEGFFGYNRLSKALGADWAKLLGTEIIPNIAIALALFLLWKFISESLKEVEGKKK